MARSSVATTTIKLLTSHLWIKLGLLLVIVIGLYAVTYWFDLVTLLAPERLETLLDQAGPIAPLVFMLLMAASVVITPIPSLPLDMAAGAVFGVLLGTTYAVIGAGLGAIASFLIGRALGRAALSRLLRSDVVFCERCSDRHLVVFVFLSRLFPVFSFDLISYGAGLTNISLRAFAIATFLGMIPPTLLMTMLGGGLFTVQWPWIIAGAVLTALFLLVPRLVVRYPSAWWVHLLRGDMPVAAVASASQATPIPARDETVPPCASCGGPVEEPSVVPMSRSALAGSVSKPGRR